MSMSEWRDEYRFGKYKSKKEGKEMLKKCEHDVLNHLWMSVAAVCEIPLKQIKTGTGKLTVEEQQAIKQSVNTAIKELKVAEREEPLISGQLQADVQGIIEDAEASKWDASEVMGLIADVKMSAIEDFAKRLCKCRK